MKCPNDAYLAGHLKSNKYGYDSTKSVDLHITFEEIELRASLLRSAISSSMYCKNCQSALLVLRRLTEGDSEHEKAP